MHRDILLQAAIKLIKEQGWSNLSFADIASKAGVTLDKVYEIFPKKIDIIVTISQLIDKETLQKLEKFSDDDTYRDKLFSLLMTRFDVLQKYKPVISQIWNEACTNPTLVISSAPKGINSMIWMLEAAQIDVSGVGGTIKAQLFGVFYLTAVNTWLKDESSDLTETMAHVDRGLEKFEMVPGFY